MKTRTREHTPHLRTQKSKQEQSSPRQRSIARPQLMATYRPADIAGRFLALQARLGNTSVQRLLSTGHLASRLPFVSRTSIQRALTAEQKAQDLRSDRFRGDERLEKAFDNSPAMRRGERSEAVAKVQQALLDDGFEMPISTRKTGSPDGIYGRETRATVIAFQRRYGLDDDGVIGRETLGKMDELYSGPTPTRILPKAKPEIEASEEEIGQHIVDDMNKANDPKSFSPTSGVWYSHNYEAMHKKLPAQYPWKPDYRSGYANPAYFMRIGWMDWLLRPGVSASAAIKAWLKGLTIAECNSTLVAIEINALRAAIGDAKFDENFGSADKAIPSTQRLRVKQGTKGTPVEKYIKQTEAAAKAEPGTFGNRPAQVGGWYYFYNHPKYLLKHPDGAFQGENAVYMGRNPAGQQLWSGLGVSNVTERRMLEIMAQDYNDERKARDYEVLVRRHAPTAPELRQPKPDFRALYHKYIDQMPDKFRHDKGVYKEKVSVQDILNDPEYELWGTKRKGGFVSDASIVLDVAKVQQTRGS